MDKKLLEDMLNKKENRKEELRGKAKTSQSVSELRSIDTELEELNNDIVKIRSLLKSIEKEEQRNDLESKNKEEKDIEERRNQVPTGSFNPVGTYSNVVEEKRNNQEENSKEMYEKRGQTLKDGKLVTFEINEMPEFRSISLGSGQLINEKKYSKEINPTFNEVSGLIDMVHGVPLIGGESYEKAYEKSSGEGDYTTEDGEYHDSDPEFGYVSIGKAKITAYTEITDEAKKLPNINYQDMVKNSIQKSLRKKITKQIVVGAGGSNALIGIFNAPKGVVPAESDISISKIDETTLDQIVFGYGGDEDVEGDAYLILNKRDLAAFAKIRATDGKKLYKIELNGNTGTISSDDSFKVPFIINSACPVLAAKETSNDTYCMAYGKLIAYELPVFSDVEVEESRDYKFKSGQIAYRGSVWAGGNVGMFKGFVRVKKVAEELKA